MNSSHWACDTSAWSLDWSEGKPACESRACSHRHAHASAGVHSRCAPYQLRIVHHSTRILEYAGGGKDGRHPLLSAHASVCALPPLCATLPLNRATERKQARNAGTKRGENRNQRHRLHIACTHMLTWMSSLVSLRFSPVFSYSSMMRSCLRTHMCQRTHSARNRTGASRYAPMGTCTRMHPRSARKEQRACTVEWAPLAASCGSMSLVNGAGNGLLLAPSGSISLQVSLAGNGPKGGGP